MMIAFATTKTRKGARMPELSRAKRQKVRSSLLATADELRRLASGRQKDERDSLLSEADELTALAEEFK